MKNLIKHKFGTFLLMLIFAGMFLHMNVAYATEGTPSEEAGTTESPTVETTPQICLKAPQIVYMGATSDGVLKLQWKSVPAAEKYVIYRSTSKKGVYKKIGTSKKTRFSDKKGKKGKTYYYKVAAALKDKETGIFAEGIKSSAKKGTVRKPARKTAYVGDSIMTGFDVYHIVGKGTRVFAKVGLNATTFYNTGLMQQMLNYKPDRMVLMFGMNGLVGSPNNYTMQTQIDCIGKIIKQCRKRNPDMEIVIWGVSPVSSSSHVRLSNVKQFNRLLEKNLKKYKNVHYYDLADVLGTTGGYLQSGYNGGDGIHWSPNAYKKAYSSINQYFKEWEQ